MATFPNDQFDDVPHNIDRVGAHRGPKVKGRGWIGFLWALLATVVLIVAGLFLLQNLDSSFSFLPGSTSTAATSTPTSTPTPTISPITDPRTIKSRKITVTVLNGTTTSGLATGVAHLLKAHHWKVLPTANASDTAIKQTVVYYSASQNKDVALGIAKTLGKSTVSLTDLFPGSPITVVLRSDYTP